MARFPLNANPIDALTVESRPAMGAMAGLEPVHAHAIEALAFENRLPVDRVADLYAAELARMTAVARIRDYLPIFISRRVKEILREQSAPRTGET